MAGSSRYIRSEAAEIERRLRSLEKTIEKLASRTSSRARDTAGGLADAVASVFQTGRPVFAKVQTLSDRSAALGTDAARYGNAALDKISEEIEQRPIIAIAALGVGILIGMATRSRS